ncbi:urease accessory protein UreD [uncultured Hymenobacter sp.]|uniref:urease accessory protein UreD n=1 Tax=uncultured Hymenobacter sp. TaxID=170016 RepID=UPI0035CC0AB0
MAELISRLPPSLAAIGPDPAWSVLEVAASRGQSRLVRCHNVQPLKLLQPAAPGGLCHVVFSSYGGGLVAGDCLRLRVRGQAGTRLLLSTQANTRIFRSPDGAVAEQHTIGELADQALAVVFPDPVVPQAGSRYRQRQHWHLAPTATLLLVDWFHAGRTDQGEQFAFRTFETELRVSVAGRLVLLDRFAFAPDEHIAAAPANFAGHQTFFSAYLIGPPGDPRFQRLAACLQAQQLPGRVEPHFQLRGRRYVVAVAQARENVWVLRAAAHSRQELQPLCDEILAALANEKLLGFNPLQRKY